MQKATDNDNVIFGGGRGYIKWNEIFDGDVNICQKGIDFNMTVESFQSACSIRAGRRGITIQTTRLGDGRVAVQKTADTR